MDNEQAYLNTEMELRDREVTELLGEEVEEEDNRVDEAPDND